MDDTVGDAGASRNSTAPPLSLTVRSHAIEHQLQRFTLEKGLDCDNDIDDKNTGEDDMSWWCRHQFAYPALARLANNYLSIPAFSAASERVFSATGNVVTKKHNKSGDDTVGALVCLDGSNGLAWSSGISQEALGRKHILFSLFVERRRLGSLVRIHVFPNRIVWHYIHFVLRCCGCRCALVL